MNTLKKLWAISIGAVLVIGVWTPLLKAEAAGANGGAESVLMISLPSVQSAGSIELPEPEMEITGSVVHLITEKAVMINWTTNVSSESHVLITQSKKQIKKFRGTAFSDGAIGNGHSVTVGLKPNKRYYAVIIAHAPDGSDRVISEVMSFRTAR